MGFKGMKFLGAVSSFLFLWEYLGRLIRSAIKEDPPVARTSDPVTMTDPFSTATETWAATPEPIPKKKVVKKKATTKRKQKSPQDLELMKITTRVRELITKVSRDSNTGWSSMYFNDPIKNGRSLKWYGTALAEVLKKSARFKKLVKELDLEGYSVKIKTTSAYVQSGSRKNKGSTRIHIRRQEVGS